jgi:hypothetical protein
MNIKTKIVDPDDAWESREVGADEQYVEVAPDIGKELDAALDLHPISIRLQRPLVENLKALAHLHGLGYQPLMRQILTRWVDSELKLMVAQRVNAKVAEEKAEVSKAARPAAPVGRAAAQHAPRHKKAA